MKRLKKYLIPFLLCSILCFSFIPKTYADTIDNGNFLIDANFYDINLTHQQQIENAYYMTVPANQFPVVYGFQINQLNFSKTCNVQYGFRVDYTLWGWHNESSINWVNYAKLISVYGSDFTTIGTIINEVNGYTLNFSTYFIWTPSYCPIDSVTSLNFRVNDSVRSPLINNFLYNPNHIVDSRSYYVYNALYEHIDISVAQNLVNEYYTSGSISNEKLDSINGQLLDVNENLDKTNEKLEDIYTDITNDDITGSQNTANGFFSDFTDNDYGLSSIITIPLSSIQKITNSTCSPINIPVPFTNKNIPLPCMGTLYEQNVPVLLNIWQIVSFGIISYAIIVDIFSMVKKFKDPNDDKLEVMDL